MTTKFSNVEVISNIHLNFLRAVPWLHADWSGFQRENGKKAVPSFDKPFGEFVTLLGTNKNLGEFRC